MVCHSSCRVNAATDTNATTEEMLKLVFSEPSVPSLHNENLQPLSDNRGKGSSVNE
jgi:hypothetical protein